MGPVVVVDHVAADHLPGLVEGLELFAPDAAFLELAEPGLDEGLALGVAVAAAAMGDPEADQDGLEGAGSERRAVVGTKRQAARRDAALGRGALDQADRFLGSAAGLEVPGDDLACAAVDRGHQIDPAVRRPTRWSCPDARADRVARRRRTPAAGDARTGGGAG